MRVSSNTSYEALRNQLNQLGSRQTQLQTQVATGLRLQSLSDDPAAMSQTLGLKNEQQAITQYLSNIATQKQVGNANYTALKSLKTVSDRVGEIATLADGLESPQNLALYQKEVSQLIQQAVQTANTKNGNNYLFGGTVNSKPPFVMTVDASGLVTSVTYQGNSDVASTEISAGVTSSAQILGVNTTGSGPRGLITDAASGADFFNHLISLQNHLAAGDANSIAATDRPDLARDEDNLILHIGQNGVTQARLETAASLISDRKTAVESQESDLTGADLAQTLTNLSQTQTAYQAALQSGAKILSLTLMDYLR